MGRRRRVSHGIPSLSGSRITDDCRSAKKAMVRNGIENSDSKTSRKGSNNSASNIRQKMVLSNEQQKVLQYVVAEGKNIFFTGSAGMSHFYLYCIYPKD